MQCTGLLPVQADLRYLTANANEFQVTDADLTMAIIKTTQQLLSPSTLHIRKTRFAYTQLTSIHRGTAKSISSDNTKTLSAWLYLQSYLHHMSQLHTHIDNHIGLKDHRCVVKYLNYELKFFNLMLENYFDSFRQKSNLCVRSETGHPFACK